MQNLALYRTPADWSRGRPLWVEALWYFIGQPLLGSELPGSGWRKALLRLFGARLGAGGCLKPRLRVKFPWRLQVGDHCWIGEGTWIDNLAPVQLGDHVCVSQNVYFCTGNHDYRSPGFGLRLGAIRIGSHAWICARATLAPGTQVGEAAVIGLGAVVSGAAPAAMILRGNPAVVVGPRQPKDGGTP